MMLTPLHAINLHLMKEKREKLVFTSELNDIYSSEFELLPAEET